MEIYKKYGKSFLYPNTQTITENMVQEMNVILSKKTPLILDLSGVENCSNSFLFMLKKKKNITIINAESKFLSILYITGFNKYVKLYGDAISYFENTRELLNRNFCIV